MKYYWVRKSGNFGRKISFGDEMPSLPEERINQLLSQGFISDKKPIDFNDASVNELAETKKQVARLSEENSALKSKIANLQKLVSEKNHLDSEISALKKLASESKDLKERVAELEAELEDFPKNVRDANKKIKGLEKDLEKATKPGGK